MDDESDRLVKNPCLIPPRRTAGPWWASRDDQQGRHRGSHAPPGGPFLLLLLVLGLVGCSSITRIGVIPETEIVCHAVKDTGFFAAGILLVCTRDGVVQAASGGAAAGPAGIATGAIGAAGVAAAGAFIGSGLRSLSSPTVEGTLKTDGTLRIAP